MSGVPDRKETSMSETRPRSRETLVLWRSVKLVELDSGSKVKVGKMNAQSGEYRDYLVRQLTQSLKSDRLFL